MTQTPVYLTLRLTAAAAMLFSPYATIHAAASLGRGLATARWNRKRLDRARSNLRVAFPHWTDDEIHACAVASYEHLMMLGAEIAYAPRLLTQDGWPRRVLLGVIGPRVDALLSGRPVILITGHCGNWEVLGFTVALLGFPLHALYRPLDLTPLDRWVRTTRQRRGLSLVDKFGAVYRLPDLMRAGAPIGFVADQNGGDRGVFTPFFGRLASTYKSIGLLALQFNADVLCGVARRLTLAEARTLRRCDTGWDRGFQYAFEITDHFGPADWSTHSDPLFYLTARYRMAVELMVRNAPEQYLWMHRIWRSRPRHERLGRPFPDQLLDKIRQLPWADEALIARVQDHSERDARTLAATGRNRLD
jgi:KDO2-lipid IV(A) lauroyltransferase